MNRTRSKVLLIGVADRSLAPTADCDVEVVDGDAFLHGRPPEDLTFDAFLIDVEGFAASMEQSRRRGEAERESRQREYHSLELATSETKIAEWREPPPKMPGPGDGEREWERIESNVRAWLDALLKRLRAAYGNGMHDSVPTWCCLDPSDLRYLGCFVPADCGRFLSTRDRKYGAYDSLVLDNAFDEDEVENENTSPCLRSGALRF